MSVDNAQDGVGVVGAQVPTDFDLTNWKGLAKLLKAIQEAPISNQERASFRDLVSQYAQNGGDTELRARIESTIARVFRQQSQDSSSVGEAPAAPQGPPAGMAAETPYIPTPPASPITAPKQVTPQATTPPQQPTQVAESDAPHNLPTGAGTAPSKPLPDEMEAAPPEAARPSLADLDSKTHLTPEEIQTRIQTEQQITDAYKARIVEIKRKVNEQVQNPITLMQAGDAIGKKYMGALLNAMKASAGGRQAGGLKKAVEELEDAYATIQAYLKEHAGEEEDSPETDAETALPKTAPAPLEDSSNEEKRDEHVAMGPAEFVKETVASEEPEPIRPPATPDTATPLAHKRATAIPSLAERLHMQEFSEERFPKKKMEEAVPEKEVPVSTQEEQVPDSQPTAALENTSPVTETEHTEQATHEALDRSKSESTEQDAIPQTTEEAAPMPEFPHTIGYANAAETPTAHIGWNKQMADKQETIEKAKLDANLMTTEVTEMLNQLLRDWDIFQKKGFLFGISGERGEKHPLWLAIAGEPMSVVLTGRNEKITPEIKKSINDYVNAWRHEQGISYQPNETLEHYLRRVIKRIERRTELGGG